MLLVACLLVRFFSDLTDRRSLDMGLRACDEEGYWRTVAVLDDHDDVFFCAYELLRLQEKGYVVGVSRYTC